MPNPVVHFEFGVRDTAKAKAFYGSLFGWEFNEYGPAVMVGNIGPHAPGMEGGQGNPMAGIGGHISCMPGPDGKPVPYCVVYVLVDDLAKTIAHAEKLGGKAMIPPTEVPDMGHFAWIRDPDGTIVGLWKAMGR